LKEEFDMTNLKVTPAQLEALGATTTRVSGDVRAQHQQLRGQLTPLFGADWSGAAAAQFTALYQQFDVHARGLSDALDGIGTLLRQAGTAYAAVEQQVAASFR
jgi:WXG100 family type VII secretion target